MPDPGWGAAAAGLAGGRVDRRPEPLPVALGQAFGALTGALVGRLRQGHDRSVVDRCPVPALCAPSPAAFERALDVRVAGSDRAAVRSFSRGT